MPPEHRSRFLLYIAGYFPEDFHVDVVIAVGDDEPLLIKIATSRGLLASFETNAAQALDVVAMGDIAQELKRRVGYL